MLQAHCPHALVRASSACQPTTHPSRVGRSPRSLSCPHPSILAARLSQSRWPNLLLLPPTPILCVPNLFVFTYCFWKRSQRTVQANDRCPFPYPALDPSATSLSPSCMHTPRARPPTRRSCSISEISSGFAVISTSTIGFFAAFATALSSRSWPSGTDKPCNGSASCHSAAKRPSVPTATTTSSAACAMRAAASIPRVSVEATEGTPATPLTFRASAAIASNSVEMRSPQLLRGP
eukprot:4507487-Pleurochrysis_carterae.AAC.2